MAAIAVLPPDMLANIHRRLSLLDRLAFAAVFRSSRHAFRPEAPCLVLPGDCPDAATIFSLAGRHTSAARALGPDHHVLGSSSSRGWLVTADAFAQMLLINPLTGERRALPAVDTICRCVSDGRHFTVDVKRFLRGPPPYPFGTMTFTAEEMRRHLYRKVVLSDSAAIAMLITGPEYGAAAFAMAGGGGWRLAPPRDGVEPVATFEGGSWRLWHSRNGVEDAIHHNGRFYSITYSGEVEAWVERDADSPGVFTSVVITPSLPLTADPDHRKYLVVAPGGQLMVVLMETTSDRTLPSFKVQVLTASGDEWEETNDIGDAALFVGANGSLYMSTREHPKIRAGCVYYAIDGRVAVLSLKGGMVQQIEGLGTHQSWPPLQWFTPCIPR